MEISFTSITTVVIATLAIFVIINFNNICNHTGDLYYNSRIESEKITPKVYDFFHRILPDFSRLKNESELILLLFLSLFILSTTFEPVYEFIIYFLVILLIRGLFINMTILPKDKECKDLNGITGGCYDKIFSGHFSAGFLASLIFYKYNIISSVPLLIVINMINAFVILATRNHYTVDILVSIFVVLTVYNSKLIN